jgi:hypothetical protein
MDYYEHYLKKLRAFIERGPAAAQVLPVLEVLNGFPPEKRFLMVQEFERLLRDTDPAIVDWEACRKYVSETVAETDDPAELGRRLREIANA